MIADNEKERITNGAVLHRCITWQLLRAKTLTGIPTHRWGFCGAEQAARLFHFGKWRRRIGWGNPECNCEDA